MYLITDLYRQPICIQPSLSTNRTGRNQRQPTPIGTAKCPNLPNCLIRQTAEVPLQEPTRQMKIHLSRKLFFRCFQNKLTKYFSTNEKVSSISALRIQYKKFWDNGSQCVSTWKRRTILANRCPKLDSYARVNFGSSSGAKYRKKFRKF